MGHTIGKFCHDLLRKGKKRKERGSCFSIEQRRNEINKLKISQKIFWFVRAFDVYGKAPCESIQWLYKIAQRQLLKID